MSKRKKRSDQAGTFYDEASGTAGWVQDGELEALVPGVAPEPAELAEFDRRWREKLRASPLWPQMVAQFGPERAEQLLQQCEMKIK